MSVLESESSNELALDRTNMAVERTAMAANRTLMAWIRTSLSYTSFGFTIYKFLEAAVKGQAMGILAANGPRRLGLMLIGLGIGSALVGTIDFYNTIKSLNALSGQRTRMLNFAFLSGCLVGLLGLFLFITILTHTEVF